MEMHSNSKCRASWFAVVLLPEHGRPSIAISDNCEHPSICTIAASRVNRFGIGWCLEPPNILSERRGPQRPSQPDGWAVFLPVRMGW
jgi:hypothetical protein